MLVTLHMFSLSVVCTLNTELHFNYACLRNFNLTPTVLLYAEDYISQFDELLLQGL